MAQGQLEEGTLLNERYRILRALGRGGMGTVYLAEHIRLQAVVAVKEVRGANTEAPDYQEALQQCEQEARFLVSLNHPNLPKVNDAFVENDRFYLVMEYVEGTTLESRLREAAGQPLEVAQVLEWGLQIADVLAYLHSQHPPIIFRDMKPANAMVQPDSNVRLIDFGIARRFQPGASRDTALLGSVGYSPPEQFGRHQTDTRSDIYAFGATLHHLLTGRDPAEQPFKFPPAHTLNPEVPEELSHLLDRCLALDSDARPAGIHEVALGLLAVRESSGLHISTPTQGVEALEGETPAEKSPSGGTRRVKIVSAKLNELEHQKRRTQRQETRRTPSGSTAGTGTGRNPGAIAAILCLIVVLGGGTLLFARSWGNNKHKETPSLPKTTAVVPPGTNTDKNTAPTGNTNGSDPNTQTEQPTDTDIVEFNTIEPQSAYQDSQGEWWVSLHAAGRIKNQAGKAGVISAFFYDANGNPILAADPRGNYADRNGYLNMPNSVDIKSNNHIFSAKMEMPLNQFPATALGGLVQFRCRVYVDGKSVIQTDLSPFALPNSLPNAPNNNGGETSTQGGRFTP